MGAGMARIRILLLLAITATTLSVTLATTAGAASRIGPAIALGGAKTSTGGGSTSAGSGAKSKETKKTAPVPTQPSPTPTPPPTEPVPTAPAPGSGPIYWGATIGSQLTGNQAPWDMTAVTKFEELTQKKLSLVQFFQPFANCGSGGCSYYAFPTAPLESIRQHGAIPVLSWSSQSIPSSVNEPDFQLSDVISGRYDAYIREFATNAKAWGHPFFLRFDWEMNGTWFPWSEGVNGNKSGEYVAAWRHVHDIFASAGATNASWVWCPNIDPDNIFLDLASQYPGNAYVDWTCLDGYNYGTSRANTKWRSFSFLFGPQYAEISGEIAPTKPMLIAEVASSEQGGSKPAWIAEMFSELPTAFPAVQGVMWFDYFYDGNDWWLDSSTAAQEAFAAAVADPRYLGNTVGGLATSPIPAP